MAVARAKDEQLLKAWESWEDGIGYLTDDRSALGMYYANKLIGMRGELRPAPRFLGTTASPLVGIDFEPQLTSPRGVQYWWEDIPTTFVASEAYLYGVVNNNQPLDQSGIGSCVVKVDLRNSTFGAILGEALTIGLCGSPSGQPLRYQSRWYFPLGVTGSNSTQLVRLGHVGTGSSNNDGWARSGGSLLNSEVMTLNGAITDVAGTLIYTSLDEANPDPYAVNDVIKIDSELIRVDSINTGTNTLTVTRAHLGSTGAAHSNGATIYWPTVLNANIASGATSMVYNSKHDPFMVGDILLMDSERVTVTAIVIGTNTLTITRASEGTTAAAHNAGANISFPSAHLTPGDHLATLNHQAVRVKRKYSALDADYGAAILTANTNLLIESNWGPFFPIGDTDERSLGLNSLAGATFVFNKEGLYSFDSGGSGTSGIVFGDLKSWRGILRESTIFPYKTGLLIGHPSGLLYFRLRDLPYSVGPDARFPSLGTPPPGGPTEFNNGRWHGVAVAGDYIYAIFQPTPTTGSGVGSGTARNALVLWGSPKGRVDPTDIVWQVIGNVNLHAKDLFTGCYVSTLGFPESSDVASPTLWVSSSDSGASLMQLFRMNLDNRATPVRARGETHVVTTTGEAWMSELFFPDPVDLSRLVVYTQDMATDDEWLFGLLIDGRPAGAASGAFSNTNEIPVGPVKTSGRTSLSIGNLNLRGVHRVMLHVKFTGTSTSARVAPSIKRIELYGRG